MPAKKRSNFPIIQPNLQISFYFRLQIVRDLYLNEALKKTISALDIRKIDGELAQYVSPDKLRRVAAFGLRGEVLFPVPCILKENPFLLGYYRLLFGLSQKEFYNKGPFGRFKRLEDRGDFTHLHEPHMQALCESLIKTAEVLVDGIDELSLQIIHELQLLTLGPQLRGGANTKIGQDATQEVFNLIKNLTASYIKDTTERTIHIVNDSNRTVMIEFFSDPDVKITEKLESGVRPLVAIEIKGGKDASNIHNRVGEAEKSHQKAKNRGFFEFWTIIRVDVDQEAVKRESPTTTHFFHIDRITNRSTKEHTQFRDLLSSLVGMRV
jgi:hypothetical protein